jgi:hypothetical protein
MEFQNDSTRPYLSKVMFHSTARTGVEGCGTGGTVVDAENALMTPLSFNDLENRKAYGENVLNIEYVRHFSL